jgi:hypothetical protein
MAIGRRLLWTSDQIVAETSTYQHTTQQTDIHAPGGIRTHDLSIRAPADVRLIDGAATGTGCLQISYSFVNWVRRSSYKNCLMHPYIIHVTLLALCYSNMFRSSNNHLHGVRQIHFHNPINKMCTKCKIRFIEQRYVTLLFIRNGNIIARKWAI